ncbi:Erp C family protein, partial (plasmid) [Borreliella bissettiae]
MNKIMKIFTICAVFAMISSCKNYASGEDLKQIKQNAEGKIKGFLDIKDKIISNGPKIDEVAKKLQEEELMQGDDPNNGVINPPSVLSASGQDNAPILKAEQQSGGQQEEGKVGKAKEAEAKIDG